jgi:hypothetical protein
VHFCSSSSTSKWVKELQIKSPKLSDCCNVWRWRVLSKHPLPGITRKTNLFRRVCNTKHQLSLQYKSKLSSYRPPHLKETIRTPQQFILPRTNNAFLLAVILTLTASIMSVSACQGALKSCTTINDYCTGLVWLTVVSGNSLLCIEFPLDDSPFAPCIIMSDRVCST